MTLTRPNTWTTIAILWIAACGTIAIFALLWSHSAAMQQLIQKDNFFGNTQDYSRVSGDFNPIISGAGCKLFLSWWRPRLPGIQPQSMIGAMSKHALLRRTLTWILEHPALIVSVIAVAAGLYLSLNRYIAYQGNAVLLPRRRRHDFYALRERNWASGLDPFGTLVST